MAEERQMSHPSSGSCTCGTTGWSASPQFPGRLWTKSYQKTHPDMQSTSQRLGTVWLYQGQSVPDQPNSFQ